MPFKHVAHKLHVPKCILFCDVRTEATSYQQRHSEAVSDQCVTVSDTELKEQNLQRHRDTKHGAKSASATETSNSSPRTNRQNDPLFKNQSVSLRLRDTHGFIMF